MILSDDEIMVINQTAEFDSAIGYARAIEAKVLEKLSDKLLDGERYRFLFECETFCREPLWPVVEWMRDDESATKADVDQAIDAAIKESK